MEVGPCVTGALPGDGKIGVHAVNGVPLIKVPTAGINVVKRDPSGLVPSLAIVEVDKVGVTVKRAVFTDEMVVVNGCPSVPVPVDVCKTVDTEVKTDCWPLGLAGEETVPTEGMIVVKTPLGPVPVEVTKIAVNELP